MDAHPDAPIALWLRTARASQRMKDANGETRPWTVKHFLALLETEIGWRLAHSNYSNYEQGKQTPTPPTLRKFVQFWAKYDVGPPDLTPVKPVAEPTLADLIQAQTAAINAQTAMLKAVLITLAGPNLTPDLQAWALQSVEAMSTGSPLPTPVPDNGTAR